LVHSLTSLARRLIHIAVAVAVVAAVAAAFVLVNSSSSGFKVFKL